MPSRQYSQKVKALFDAHEALVQRPNPPQDGGNGIFTRYQHPILTAAHTPVFWRYDLDETSNPFLMERQGINAAFNAGAILFEGRYLMVVRVEGVDRKSFFAVAESPNGIDQWRFWAHPITIPETDRPDVNVYDMRLTKHADGWIYGVFCTERKARDAATGDTSAAEAQAGIVRTRDFNTWYRLPDLQSPSAQQRNVVLHPEYVEGKYAFYTRPQDGFIGVGTGGGIGFGTCDDIEAAVLQKELVMDARLYHTIKEAKNGQGPAPIKTRIGWLHLAHGVRNTAAGLRYVLYLFVSDLLEPWRVTHAPAGYLIAPEGEERIGDVSNVVFSNGWILNDQEEVFIYYGSSDTRMHVATTTLAQLIDYVQHTPSDGLRSAASVEARNALISKNLQLLSDFDWYAPTAFGSGSR